MMSDIKFDCAITFVYNTENYEDFIENKIDKSTIIKIYEPKLPIFTLENSVNRNEIWENIDNECKDIYWTQACKSGIQYPQTMKTPNNDFLYFVQGPRILTKKLN